MKTPHFNTKHGDCCNGRISSEWLAWKNMQDRCEKELNDSYHRYGARGIKVCKKWKEGFSNFLRDMGRKPTKKHSLDRIDVNGDYSPENCRWATTKEQQNNKTTNRVISFLDCCHTLQEWADILEMDKRTLLWRFRAGWNVEDCLTKPIKRKGD